MHECIQSSRQENKGKNEKKTDRVVKFMRHILSASGNRWFLLLKGEGLGL